jgi:hypothetical protein
MTGKELAETWLEKALAEQLRLKGEHERLAGQPGEAPARMRLRAADLRVSVWRRSVETARSAHLSRPRA